MVDKWHILGYNMVIKRRKGGDHMTLKEMQELKKEMGLTNQMIAERSGVPLATVQKVFGGSTSSPRYETRIALEKAFSQKKNSTEYSTQTSEPWYVSEPEPAYGSGISRDGKTIDDYLALPEGVRVELIDGRFYDMAAPTNVHQNLVGLIYYFFLDHVMKNNGPCVPALSPLDVQLDRDDKTMVQPDVMIICDRDKITKPRVVGAPEMVVEVVSPSNWYVDANIKLKKYRAAGVREYWMVIPEIEKTIVYLFDPEEPPKEYSFDEKVPVAVWDGKCEIDFPVIKEKLDTLFGNRS